MPLLNENTKKGKYLVNFFTDLLTAGGGLSLFLFPFLYLTSSAVRAPEMIRFATMASFVINYPHFAATLYRLYHNKENRSSYPFTTYAAPFLFIALFLTALHWPQSFGGYYCKAFLIWSGYHYSGQTLGIGLIYARRAGFPIGAKARLLLTAAIFSTYLFPIVRAETNNLDPFFGIAMPSFHLPLICATAMQWLLTLSWTAFLTYIILAPRYYGGKRVPVGVLLPIFAQFCWYIPGSYAPSFYELVPLFHGLQYLLIVWVFQMKELKQSYETKEQKFSGTAYWFENIKYGFALFILGALLFRWIPDSLAMFKIPINIAEPLWIATVQLHHFWTDGVIWRLRKQQVGQKLLVPESAPFVFYPNSPLLPNLMAPAPPPLNKTA